MLRKFQEEIEELRKKLAEEGGGDSEDEYEEEIGPDGKVHRRKSTLIYLLSFHALISMNIA